MKEPIVLSNKREDEKIARRLLKKYIKETEEGEIKWHYAKIGFSDGAYRASLPDGTRLTIEHDSGPEEERYHTFQLTITGGSAEGIKIDTFKSESLIVHWRIKKLYRTLNKTIGKKRRTELEKKRRQKIDKSLKNRGLSK